MQIPLCEGEPIGAVMLSNLPISSQVEDVHYLGPRNPIQETLICEREHFQKKMSTAARFLKAKMETTCFINKKRHKLPCPCAM